MPNPFYSCLRASWVYCADIDTEGTVFAERRALVQGGQVRRQEIKLKSLSPSGIFSPISELGEEFVMRFYWRAGFGKWPFAVRCGNGVSALDLPGQRPFRFRKGSSTLACPVLWVYEGRNFCSRSCLRSTLSPLLMLWQHDLEFCSVVSEDQLSTLLKIR